MFKGRCCYKYMYDTSTLNIPQPHPIFNLINYANYQTRWLIYPVRGILENTDTAVIPIYYPDIPSYEVCIQYLQCLQAIRTIINTQLLSSPRSLALRCKYSTHASGCELTMTTPSIRMLDRPYSQTCTRAFWAG